MIALFLLVDIVYSIHFFLVLRDTPVMIVESEMRGFVFTFDTRKMD